MDWGEENPEALGVNFQIDWEEAAKDIDRAVPKLDIGDSNRMRVKSSLGVRTAFSN